MTAACTLALRDLLSAFDMEGGHSRRKAMAEALAFARTALLADAMADEVVKLQRAAEAERCGCGWPQCPGCRRRTDG